MLQQLLMADVSNHQTLVKKKVMSSTSSGKELATHIHYMLLLCCARCDYV